MDLTARHKDSEDTFLSEYPGNNTSFEAKSHYQTVICLHEYSFNRVNSQLSKRFKLNDGLSYIVLHSLNDSLRLSDASTSAGLLQLYPNSDELRWNEKLADQSNQSVAALDDEVVLPICKVRRAGTYQANRLNEFKGITSASISAGLVQNRNTLSDMSEFMRSYDPREFMGDVLSSPQQPTFRVPQMKIKQLINSQIKQEERAAADTAVTAAAASDLLEGECSSEKKHGDDLKVKVDVFQCRYSLEQRFSNLFLSTDPVEASRRMKAALCVEIKGNACSSQDFIPDGSSCSSGEGQVRDSLNYLRMKKGLKNMFFLYLNGDCRGIKESFCMQEDSLFQAAISNRYVSYKYKSKHINFDFHQRTSTVDKKKGNREDVQGSRSNTVKKEIENKNNNNNNTIPARETLKKEEQVEEVKVEVNNKQNTQEVAQMDNNMNNHETVLGNNNEWDNYEKNALNKHVIYNKSKYVMQFLLTLMDPEHLELLNIPSGFSRKIAEIQDRMRENSRKNKLSQSQFFNHSHFDCLFLQVHAGNIDAMVAAGSEISVLHEKIFGFQLVKNTESSNIVSSEDFYELQTLNMLKQLLCDIVLIQVNIIKNEIIPTLAIHSLSFKSASKLNYFSRICDSIFKLSQGVSVAKF